ncbi:MAG: sulfite exporter TauE/SafE family protein [Ruminococcaceae bacterium]|nr:sulfite exporter TauE/SafE family protein [Oscillospiraceae bacterium]
MILATFLIAVLCGMGVGSGGLFVVYLTVFLSIEQLAAQGLNLYFFIFSTAAALIIHVKKQNLPIKRLLYLCSFGVSGCIFGAMLAQNISGDALRTVFALFLIISGTASLFSGRNFKKSLYK